MLVLGATGMLGHELVRLLADELDVHAAVRTLERARRADLRADLLRFDAYEAGELPALLERTAADAVVNRIGIVKRRPEASAPIAAIRIDALFPHEVARACADRGH